jgi:hypothetical protein
VLSDLLLLVCMRGAMIGGRGVCEYDGGEGVGVNIDMIMLISKRCQGRLYLQGFAQLGVMVQRG